MEYKYLGKSDLKISRISFGCMGLTEGHPDNEALLKKAYDLGINCFDTADLYHKGGNEIVVGNALKAVRSKIYIATKVGNEWKADGSGWRWNPTKDYILKAVEMSLKRLQTDYIDLYQLHGGTIEDAFDDTLEAFELLKKQGKIRHYGISSIRPNVIRRWLDHSEITSNMMQYSLLDRRPEEQCLDWLKENNAGVLVRGGIAKGLLAGKPAAAYLDYSEQEVSKLKQALLKLSKNRTSGQAALSYVLRHPAVTSAVVGIRTMEQLIEATDQPLTEGLNEEEYEMLKAVIEPKVYEAHRS